MIIKKESITPQKLGSQDFFEELLIGFSTKVNLLYLLYLMAQKCWLLHLIKQNCCYDYSKASGSDCIPVVLKNCEPEISYRLAEFFNICLRESCFQDCWKVLLVVPVFKNDGKRSTTMLVFLLLKKSLKNELVNNRLADHLQKWGPFSDFLYGLWSFQSIADLLTVVSDRIARAFNQSGAIRALTLAISQAFDRVWHAGLLHRLKS